MSGFELSPKKFLLLNSIIQNNLALPYTTGMRACMTDPWAMWSHMITLKFVRSLKILQRAAVWHLATITFQHFSLWCRTPFGYLLAHMRSLKLLGLKWSPFPLRLSHNHLDINMLYKVLLHTSLCSSQTPLEILQEILSPSDPQIHPPPDSICIKSFQPKNAFAWALTFDRIAFLENTAGALQFQPQTPHIESHFPIYKLIVYLETVRIPKFYWFPKEKGKE